MGIVKICNIYSAIQGEGKYTGYPTTFIKEPVELSQGSEWSLDRIMRKVSKLGNRHVVLKGGTLLQDESYSLIYELLAYSYIVVMETNCRQSIAECLYNRTYSYSLIINCALENTLENLPNLKPCDEVKFVIKDDADFTYVRKALKEYPTSAIVTLYPFKNDCGTREKIKDFLNTTHINARLGVKLHKLIS